MQGIFLEDTNELAKTVKTTKLAGRIELGCLTHTVKVFFKNWRISILDGSRCHRRQ